MPVATQPKPAAKPAAAPNAVVVAGVLRNMARLMDIISVRRKLMPKILAMLVGAGASVKALARCQALPKTAGEYQRPPRRKAETAAARIAQKLRVCRFIGEAPYLALGVAVPEMLSQSIGPETKRWWRAARSWALPEARYS